MSDVPADRPTLVKRLLHILRGEDASSAAMRESLEEVIEESERQSPALSAQERVMMTNLLAFGELKVQDVMVPRADIIAVDETMPLGELVNLFREAKHSRLPIYRETLDDPTGLVHVKDLMGLFEAQPGGAYRLPKSAIARVKRPILFAPPSMRALDLLLKMQASHTHLALVIDDMAAPTGWFRSRILSKRLSAISPTSMTRKAPACAATARPSSPMRGWSWKISRPRPASIWPPRIWPGMWIRWAGWWCRSWGGCRSGARSWPIRPAMNSKCWRPIPAVWGGCASGRMTKIPAHEFSGPVWRLDTGTKRLAAGRAGVRRRGLFRHRFCAPGIFSALLLGFAILLLLLDSADESARPLRAAFVSGWAFAFGQYLIGWHWIGYAFLVDPGAHLWQMPFALVFLTAGLALWVGIGCGLALYFWQDGAARLLVFAIFYGAAEWVRAMPSPAFPGIFPAMAGVPRWRCCKAPRSSASMVFPF